MPIRRTQNQQPIRDAAPHEQDAVALAARVIALSDRQHPADEVLRQLLKNRRGLWPGDAARVAEMAFDYFRWRGWLNLQVPVHQQLRQAVDFSQRFARDPESFRDDELVLRTIPDWTKEEMKVAPEWVRSLQRPARLWLRARRGTGPALARKLGDCLAFGPGALEDTLEYRGGKDLFRTEEFHAGEFEVQDLASQAVGLMCAPRPGETWWDACAGEGGKMLHLSDLMQNRGLIWATDRAAWRLQRLKRRTSRAQVFNYRAAIWQNIEQLPTRTKFDGVLVDAPCSGIGTWGRNPHARWTTTLQDVKELAALQQNLLKQAASAVKPGGKLVYSVCTLAHSETVSVADDLERQFPLFEPDRIANPLEPGTAPAARHFFWPERSGGNGMFVAAWKRH